MSTQTQPSPTDQTTEPDFERLDAIGDFIAELRNAAAQWRQTPAELEEMALAWAPLVAHIATGYFLSRDDDSLYVHCASRGCIKAEQVRDVYNAGPGAEIQLQAERAADIERETQLASEPATVGSGRQRAIAWLRARGIGEDKLTALAAA